MKRLAEARKPIKSSESKKGRQTRTNRVLKVHALMQIIIANDQAVKLNKHLPTKAESRDLSKSEISTLYVRADVKKMA